MNPNGRCFEQFPLPSFDTQSKIDVVTTLYRIAETTGLKSCLDLAFGRNSKLILSLASYYVIARASTAMLNSDFMFDHHGKEDDIVSESSISRLFDSSMTREKVDSFRFAFLRHCFPSSDTKGKKRIYVDIDSTNVYAEFMSRPMKKGRLFV